MNTIDFTIKITGIPKKEFDELCNDIKKVMLKEQKIVVNPTNDVKCSFRELLECDLEPFYGMVGWALTMQSMQDEIKNGN